MKKDVKSVHSIISIITWHAFTQSLELIGLSLSHRLPWALRGHGENRTHIGLWASYQMRKIACYACAGNARNVFIATDFKGKPLVRDPGMHHGTCVTHVPWCMLGSLTGGGGENVPSIPSECTTRIFTYLARGPWFCLYLHKMHDNCHWTVSRYTINEKVCQTLPYVTYDIKKVCCLQNCIWKLL